MGTIIDSHCHLWLHQDTVVDGCHIHSLEGNASRSTFFDGERQMLPPFMIDGRNTVEVFLSNMDYAQVEGAVVVQEFIDGLQNDYLAEVARKYGNRIKVCAMADFRKDGFLEEITRLINTEPLTSGQESAAGMASSLYSGVAIPGHRLAKPLDSPEMMQMYRLMEEKNMVLSLCLHEDNHQLGEVENIISQCPDIKIAIGHFGMVTTEGWMEQIKLARHRNVMVESGGITWLFNSEFYPYPSAVKAIRQAINEVGAEKLMWGSDYPRTITAITYRMSYDFITKTSELTDLEKKLLLGENAKRFYGFGELPELPYIKNMSE